METFDGIKLKYLNLIITNPGEPKPEDKSTPLEDKVIFSVQKRTKPFPEEHNNPTKEGFWAFFRSGLYE